VNTIYKFILILSTSIFLIACGSGSAQNPEANSDIASNTTNNVTVPDTSTVTNTDTNTNTTVHEEEENTPDVPAQELTQVTKPVPLFIIGDSTVHNGMDRNGKRVGWGWGDVLNDFAKDRSKVTNYARSGTSSLTFATRAPRSNPKLKHWDKTKQGIKSADISKGAFLMIQFGGNDRASAIPLDPKIRTAPEKNIKIAKERGKTLPSGLTSFEDNLRRYIDFALAHNVTPVLVTSPSVRSLLYNTCDQDNPNYVGLKSCDARRAYWLNPAYSKYDNHPFRGQTLDYPQAMRDLQKKYVEEGKTVLLLDLTKASFEFYLKDAAPRKTSKEVNNYLKKYSYGDDVHTNKLGADKLAELIKKVACHTDKGLCLQFK